MAKTPTSTPKRPPARKPAAPRKPAAARKSRSAPAQTPAERAVATLRRNALPLAGAIAAGAAAAAAIFFTRRETPQGHPAPDLKPGAHTDRADPHFRPDMDAPMTAQDREALTPPLEKPTLVE